MCGMPQTSTTIFPGACRPATPAFDWRADDEDSSLSRARAGKAKAAANAIVATMDRMVRIVFLFISLPSCVLQRPRLSEAVTQVTCETPNRNIARGADAILLACYAATGDASFASCSCF